MSKTIFIMGVSGTGKTTIGKRLGQRMGISYFEGDDFHPKENIEKMRLGKPLNDNDRKEWLETLNKVALKAVNDRKDAIISCSALKVKYRKALVENLTSKVEWVYLKGNYETIRKRMEKREHFMPTGLLKSQFETLEEPTNAIEVDVNNEVENILNQIIKRIDAN